MSEERKAPQCYTCHEEITFDPSRVGKNGKKIPLNPKTMQPHKCNDEAVFADMPKQSVDEKAITNKDLMIEIQTIKELLVPVLNWISYFKANQLPVEDPKPAGAG